MSTSSFLVFTSYYDITNRESYYFGLIQDSIQGITPDLFHNDFVLINKLLMGKFKHWSMRYFSIPPLGVEADQYSIDEYDRIFRDAYVNFYWINKKNVIENLNMFSDINNWGSSEKTNVKQLVVENYIPLSSDIATPHSESPMTSESKNQYIDYMKYYNSIISTSNKFYNNFYAEFLPIFKLMYN